MIYKITMHCTFFFSPFQTLFHWGRCTKGALCRTGYLLNSYSILQTNRGKYITRKLGHQPNHNKQENAQAQITQAQNYIGECFWEFYNLFGLIIGPERGVAPYFCEYFCSLWISISGSSPSHCKIDYEFL